MDADVAYLNHGSFGAAPRAVLDAQARLREQMERQAVRFLYRDLPEALRGAADRLAGALGARGEDLGFVDNATTAVNAVARSLDLRAGDVVVATAHVYPAVHNALRYVCDRSGAEVRLAAVPFPVGSAQEVVDAVDAVVRPGVRLAVLDHITSATGLVLPIAELVAVCRSRGVPVLVDGAHAPGQVPLDLGALDPDWYTGNCHKWLFAPKGCAFLWARHDRQDVHPTVISHGFGQGFTAEFDWQGTRDPTPWLAVSAALDFVDEHGADAIRAHNDALCAEAASMLAEAWGVSIPSPTAMRAAMCTLPPPAPVPPSWEAADALNDALWRRHRIEVPVFPFGDRSWIRISAQIYNEPDEYVRLRDAMLTEIIRTRSSA